MAQARRWNAIPVLVSPTLPQGDFGMGNLGGRGGLPFSIRAPFWAMRSCSRNEVSIPMTKPAQPWQVPVRVEDVPETGLHVDLVADARVRADLAALAGVQNMPRLEAAIDLARHG